MNSSGAFPRQPHLTESAADSSSLEQQGIEAFRRLRAVCPMAGLTSELVAQTSGSTSEPHGKPHSEPHSKPHSELQVGHYIVKATVLVGGIVVAGALGEAESLALAEHQARLRALALLGYGAGAGGYPANGVDYPADAKALVSAVPSLASPAVANGAPNGGPARPAPASTVEPPRGETAEAYTPEAVAVEAVAVEAVAVEPPAPVAIETPATVASETPAAVASAPPSKPKRGKPSKKSIEVAPSESIPPEPTIPAEDPLLASPGISTDWSEELSQIAVELKRLSWTAKQEADYLLRTYGFASRDDIIEYDQLTDYLSYLRALPSHFLPDSTESPEDEAKTQFDWDALNVGSSYPAPDDAVVAGVGYQPEEDITGSGDGFDPVIANLPRDFGGTIAQPVQAQPVQAQPVQAQPVQAKPSRTPDVDPFPALESQEYSAPDYSLDDYSTSQEPFGQDSFGDELSMSRSEMMERSAAECKRLKWTNRQGSDYLKATYGKPTRNDLTNQELWEFLQHLQSLSSTVEQLPF